MTLSQTARTKGLSIYQIKLIAVFFMTVDHLGAFGFEIPLLGACYSQLRLVGRIAAPLFIFALTEGLQHTRSKPRLFLRLYVCAVGVGLFTAVTNFLFRDSIGEFFPGNILFTYFYITLYVMLIEGFSAGAKDRNPKVILLVSFGMAIPGGLQALCEWLSNLNLNNMEFAYARLIRDTISSFVVGPLDVDYTIWFVIMGVMMYFARNKYGKVAVFVLFCGISYFGTYALTTCWNLITKSGLFFIIGYPQYWMILAAPIMLLYNGEKGRGDKWFFYLYYPTHRYGISIVSYLYQTFCGM